MAMSETGLAVLDVKFAAVLPHLDERQRRLYLAAEADALGHGGIAVVARLAEVSESTITRGRLELAGGAPVSPLRWTTASLRDLAGELTEAGHPISAPAVGDLLRSMGFSLQGMAKKRAGSQVPDRDAQFQHINTKVAGGAGLGGSRAGCAGPGPCWRQQRYEQHKRQQQHRLHLDARRGEHG